jgi:ABC-2 type transport system permease protein
MSNAIARQPAVSARPVLSMGRRAAPRGWQRLPRLGSRLATFAIVEMQKLSHDRTELVTRAIQPMLWLLIFGETFSRIRGVNTNSNVPYLSFLAPGIIAQSALFISIFYGIQIIWERDAGILNKLLVTPTPRTALIAGKAFAAGVRSIAQVLIIVALCLVMRIRISFNPVHVLGAVAIVFLGAAFFSCLSMVLAGIMQTRDRMMGVGQAITMPLFFASNALYPVDLMPTWLRLLSQVNPLSYQVSALRGLLIGTATNLWMDFAVLLLAALLGIWAAASLLGRLVR